MCIVEVCALLSALLILYGWDVRVGGGMDGLKIQWAEQNGMWQHSAHLRNKLVTILKGYQTLRLCYKLYHPRLKVIPPYYNF